MKYSQEFIDAKLEAIRECQGRAAPEEVKAERQKANAASASELRAKDAFERNRERNAKKAEEDRIKSASAKAKADKQEAIRKSREAGAAGKGKVKKKKQVYRIESQEPRINNQEVEKSPSPKKEPGFKPEQKRERSFKTRPLNLEEKIKVEVKKGLWVYVDSGTDIAEVKAKYNKPVAKTFLNEHEKAMAKKKGLIDLDREAYQF